MLKMLLENKMVVFNALTLLVSLAAGAGILKSSDITPEQLSGIATGVVALVSAINGVAHSRASRSVDVRTGDTPAPEARGSPDGNVGPGGA